MSDDERRGLAADNIVAGYGDALVLHGVSVAMRIGSITGVIGPNGSGKSTLLRVFSGLLPARSGRILLDGEDIGALPARKRLARGLAFVPQEHTVFTHMTVLENLLMGAWMWRGSHLEVRQRVDEACAAFPTLVELRNRPSGMLSGGQQKQLELARAMVSRPRYLIVDEPTAGLSPSASDHVYTTLQNIARGGKIGILLVDQNVREALRLASYVYVLTYGRNDVEGEANAISSRLNDVVQAWLGPPAAAQATATAGP